VLKQARHRRTFLRATLASLALVVTTRRVPAADAPHPDRAWYLEAKRMQELAESWGDQSYGAVVVAGGKVVGYGPSRVVKDQDPNAHAERVAIREAQTAQAGSRLTGAVLYSTSRPCLACEQAAAMAGILRMYHGEGLLDAGVPRPR
jgi:tRNA(adenine34) deaminase